MRSKGCARRLHHPQPDLPDARERRRGAELRSVGRGAGLEGQAHRHRRMLDGRRRARPRPDVVRRAAAGARRSGATAADPGRRLLHRRRARRDADRGAPAGAATIRSCGCRWTSARATGWSPATTARRRWCGATTLDPQRVLDADQVLVGRNATRRAYNMRHARAPRLRRRAAGGRRQARVPAQQPAQGPVQRRPVDGEGEARRPRAADHAHAAAARRRTPAARERQGLGAAGMLHRRRSRSSNGRSASATTSSTSAMCSPCTRRRARSGTTWCCSTSSFAFPDSRERWLYTGVTRAAKRLTVVV